MSPAKQIHTSLFLRAARAHTRRIEGKCDEKPVCAHLESLKDMRHAGNPHTHTQRKWCGQREVTNKHTHKVLCVISSIRVIPSAGGSRRPGGEELLWRCLFLGKFDISTTDVKAPRPGEDVSPAEMFRHHWTQVEHKYKIQTLGFE